jgi:Ca2+-binding RTX toxin-like protein
LGGNNIADVQRLTIVADPSNANGSALGGIRMGNAVFGSASGVVGIAATNVAVQDVVTIGDINATGSAIPTLNFGTNSQFGTVNIAGGDLVNSKTISNSGYKYDVSLNAGTTSGGTTLAASTNYAGLSFTQAPASVAAAAGRTFDLTANTDSGANFTGGSGNDTFTATNLTLTTGDSIVGGDGTDRLNLTTTAAAALGSQVTSSGIEQVSITNQHSAANSLDATLITGVTDLYFNSSAAGFTVTQIPSLPNAHFAGAVGTYTVTPTTTASAGTSDAVTVALNGTGVSAAASLVYDGVETMNVVATGSASGKAANPVSLSGSALKIVSVDSTLANFLTVPFGAAVSSTVTGTFTGGSGNDTVTLSYPANSKISANLGTGDDSLTVASFTNASSTSTGRVTLVGGDGTDTLVYSGAVDVSAKQFENVSGFEKLRIEQAVNFYGATSDVTYVAAVTGQNLGESTTGGLGLASGGTLTLEAGGTLTLRNAAWTTPTADAITINVGKSGSSGTEALDTTITADKAETVTVNGLTKTTPTTTAVHDFSISGDSVSRINVTGAVDVNLTGGGSKLTYIDASGVTAKFNMTGLTTGASATQGLTIIGAAGADTITGGAGNDSFVGGAGADSLTGGGGSDWLQGDAGNDTFAFADTLSDAVTIAGGADSDTIRLSNADLTRLNGYSIPRINTLNANISDVENVTLTDALAQSFDVGRLDGISNITLAAGSNGTAQTISGLAATNSVSLNAANGNSLTLTLANSDGAADAASITLSRTTSLTSGAIVVPAVESITVAANIATGTSATGVAHRIDLDAAAATTLTIGASNAETFTVDVAGSTKIGTIGTSGTVSSKLVINASGAANAISITGAGAADNFQGGAYGDTLTGGSGADTLAGNGGNDRINGDAGADSLSGGTGDDTLMGGADADTLRGNEGMDSLVGGEGADLIQSGAGEDTIDLTETTSAADTVLLTAADSGRKVVTGANNDRAEDTVVGFNFNTDTVRLEATLTAGYDHTGAHTVFFGTAVGDDGVSDVAGTFATDVVVFNLNTPGTASFTGGDVAVNLSGSTLVTDTTSLTVTDVKSRLQYDLTLSSGATAITVVGGGLNDAFTIDTSTTIDLNGGAGTDSLTITAAKTATLTSVETINLTGDGTALTLANASGAAAIRTVTGNTTGAGVEKVVFAGGGASAFTVDLSAASFTTAVADLTGSSAADELRGGNGNDTIAGAGAADLLYGNAGNDVFSFGSNADLAVAATVSGGDGDDRILVSMAALDIVDASFATVASVKELALTGISTAVLGTNANTAGIDTVITGNGNTSITATVIPSVTVNAAAFAGDDDTLTLSGSSNFTVTGSSAGGAISAAGGSGTLTINLPDETSAGGGANATSVTVGTGNVTINGTTGAALDTITVNGLGTDGQTFTGTVAKFVVNGGGGAQNITGGVDADTLKGGAGADTINGGGGADSIEGEAGIDTLTGGAGIDTFVVTSTATADRDVITDFTLGTGGDVLQFDRSDLGLEGTAANINDGTLVQIGLTNVAATDDVIVLTDTGYASDAAAYAAVSGAITNAAGNNDAVIIYYNTTTGKTHVIHVTNVTDDTGVTPTLVAVLDSVTTLASLQGAVAGNFGGRD